MKPKYKIVIIEGAEAGDDGKAVVVTEPTDLRPPGLVHIQTAPGVELTPNERLHVERFVLSVVAERRSPAA